MYKADLKHPDQSLQNKLEALYALSRGVAMDLSFRPPYLDLLEKFGNPQDHLPPTIHVAGTNGKGSTIATLRAILEAGGYKVHTYTSPHLLRFNERIVLTGEMIGNEALESLIDEAMALNGGAQITFFEITTAMAFTAFARVPADILLLETGLGGRLDCTNIISKPSVSIINALSMDHTEFLGNTLAQIAREKAGIIKYETPCIVGYQPSIFTPDNMESAMYKIVEQAVDKQAPLFRAGIEWSCAPQGHGMAFTIEDQNTTLPRPNLEGVHQIGNAGAALAALHVMRGQFPLSRDAIEKGLTSIHWPARLEHIKAGHLYDLLPENASELWYDGGHNDSAGAALATQIRAWQETDPKPTHMILGMKADKDPAAYLNDILPLITSLHIVPLDDTGGCVTAGQIEPVAACHADLFYRENATILEALREITTDAPDTPLRIIICGSLYLAEKIA